MLNHDQFLVVKTLAKYMLENKIANIYSFVDFDNSEEVNTAYTVFAEVHGADGQAKGLGEQIALLFSYYIKTFDKPPIEVDISALNLDLDLNMLTDQAFNNQMQLAQIIKHGPDATELSVNQYIYLLFTTRELGKLIYNKKMKQITSENLNSSLCEIGKELTTISYADFDYDTHLTRALQICYERTIAYSIVADHNKINSFATRGDTKAILISKNEYGDIILELALKEDQSDLEYWVNLKKDEMARLLYNICDLSTGQTMSTIQRSFVKVSAVFDICESILTTAKQYRIEDKISIDFEKYKSEAIGAALQNFALFCKNNIMGECDIFRLENGNTKELPAITILFGYTHPEQNKPQTTNTTEKIIMLLDRYIETYFPESQANTTNYNIDFESLKADAIRDAARLQTLINDAEVLNLEEYIVTLLRILRNDIFKTFDSTIIIDLLKTIKITEYREQIIFSLAKWVLHRTNDDSYTVYMSIPLNTVQEKQSLTIDQVFAKHASTNVNSVLLKNIAQEELNERTKMLSKCIHHLNGAELRLLLDMLYNWQLDLGANNLKKVMQCKLQIEKAYAASLDYAQLLSYNAYLSDTLECLPITLGIRSKEFFEHCMQKTSEDSDRMIIIKHDRALHKYVISQLALFAQDRVLSRHNRDYYEEQPNARANYPMKPLEDQRMQIIFSYGLAESDSTSPLSYESRYNSPPTSDKTLSSGDIEEDFDEELATIYNLTNDCDLNQEDEISPRRPNTPLPSF